MAVERTDYLVIHWILDLSRVAGIVGSGLDHKSRVSKRKHSGPSEPFLLDLNAC